MAHVQVPEQQGFIVVLRKSELEFGSKNVRIPVPKVENLTESGPEVFTFEFRIQLTPPGFGSNFRNTAKGPRIKNGTRKK